MGYAMRAVQVLRTHVGTVVVITAGRLGLVNNRGIVLKRVQWTLPRSFLICVYQAGQSQARWRWRWILEQTGKGTENKD